jgi:hypothetical protein
VSKIPQLLERSQSLWESGWLAEREEGAACGLESVIVERDCIKKG